MLLFTLRFWKANSLIFATIPLAPTSTKPQLFCLSAMLQVYNSAGTVANSAKTISAASDTVQGVNVLTYVDETAVNGDSRPGVKVDQVLNVANEGAVAVFVTGSVTPASVVRVLFSQAALARLVNSVHAACFGQNCSSFQCSLSVLHHW
jgi:Cu/Ag efflux pump CusA